MLGDIVLFTYDELIIVITMMSEEYKNNITCNGISCAGTCTPMSSYTRSTHQHVVVMKLFSGNAESQMP